jgi:preprotein translocase subunit SecD
MSAIRDNWRVGLLVVAVLLSAFALFSPTLASGQPANATNATGGDASSATNLNYGLELAGGTRIQAPLTGWTATDVDFSGQNESAVESTVAAELENVTTRDVELVAPSEETSRQSWALEVRADVSKAAATDAVDAANVSTAETSVRPGMTTETRDRTVRILEQKVNGAGISGGTVRSVYSVTEGRYYVVVEVPRATRTQVLDRISERGQVTVLAYHPVEQNGTTVYTNRTVLTNDDIVAEPPQQAQGGNPPGVPITVRDGEDEQGRNVRERFQQDMVETGVAQRGGTACGFPQEGPCLLALKDGSIVYDGGMNPSLANPMVDGTWADSGGGFVLQTTNYSQAQGLSIDLRAGALPTELAIGADTASVRYVSPTFGQSARLNAILAAIAAIVAVSAVVVARYGDVRVAVPMVLTGLAEVFLLLGFAAGVGLALDLSHIAGFIAVIGTGVDDLIIIADEILQQGEVRTGRVFKSRFRKALAVIGMAAATTIIAMSPLAVLNLQDLRGFAIVTIVGVLLGVLITRPAYGDILRNLVLE